MDFSQPYLVDDLPSFQETFHEGLLSRLLLRVAPGAPHAQRQPTAAAEQVSACLPLQVHTRIPLCESVMTKAKDSQSLNEPVRLDEHTRGPPIVTGSVSALSRPLNQVTAPRFARILLPIIGQSKGKD
jgi:hypothetical protein